jgi:thioredoxin-related protein
MKKFCLMVLYIPMLLRAQEKGVEFVQGITWDQVKAKAKAENKYVFVDIFATWCGPCKMMDRDVYTNDTVMNAMAGKMIAVKLQMDSSSADNAQVRNWYSVARMFNKQYSIPGYPSFFFFSPEGSLVYKDLGYRNVPDFVNLVNKALGPQSLLYYTQLEEYKKGKRNYKSMGGLSLFVKNVVGNRDLADSIARDCKKNYLDKLTTEQLCTKDNFEFASGFSSLIDLKDNYFKLFYNQPDSVDQIMKSPGWASVQVYNALIMDLEHRYRKDKLGSANPDWTVVESKFKNLYPNLKFSLDDMILRYQVYYFSRLGDWGKWYIYWDKQIQQNPPKGAFDTYVQLNVYGAWSVFINCNDTSVLDKMLSWIDIALDSAAAQGGSDPELDTKAALLYKLGKVDEAISTEQLAIETGEKNAKKGGGTFSPDAYNAVIDKMKKGEPTYLEEHAKWDVDALARIKRNTN